MRGIILDIDKATRDQVETFTREDIPGLWGVKLGDRFVFEGAENIMHRLGKRVNVFADLKHYDIEDRLRRLVAQYAALGEYAPKMLTICGDRRLPAIKAAVEERGDIDIIVTTVLSDEDEERVGDPSYILTQHIENALDAGAQGITCPAWLLPEINLGDSGLKIVATGIRSNNTDPGNHTKACSAAYAFKKGATFAVVGSEVLLARSPLARLKKIISSCKIW